MTGSMISIIVITAAFAMLAFIVAFILSYTLGASKIETDKRMEELKKQEGYVDVSLVKNKKKERKKREAQSDLFVKLATALYKQLQSADIKMRPEEFMLIWVIVAVLPALFVLLISESLAAVALGVGIVGAVAPYMLIKIKQKQRVKKFDVQLSDALMISCSSLRAGLSFTQAMEAISKDMPDPIASEFATVLDEMAMGMPMDEALERLNTRIKSKYLPLMVSSVLIQRQTGGNLSSILEGIADSIKEKMKLKQELKSLTSSGRSTATMVGSMPVVLCILFFLVNREFIMPLFTTSTGHIFLGVAAGLEVLCFIVVKKIITIKM